MNQSISRDFFIQYLKEYYSLTEREVLHLMEDFQHYYHLDLKEYVLQRHLQLKKNGLLNQAIYRMIQEEIKEHRFAGKELTVRQIRRMIYG